MSDRADSWKDIADYLGRDVRTVQRWEAERGLPVHRLPGGDKPRVYALKSELDAWLRSSHRAAEPMETPSVAVLPFVNLSESKENEYFSDGLADEIINALTRISNLRVIARTSSFAFRGKELDVREIGARLGASTLLEGSVRRYGKRVRISAQHVSTRDGCHLWSESYDREFSDIFEIQDEIARSIEAALKLKLMPPVVRPTEDLHAYDLWVKGRSISHQYTPAAFAEARDCYERAIARDPRFAKPYFGLAELLYYGVQFGLTASLDILPCAREAITKSLELDDLCGDAHALLGIFRGLLDYDWPGAQAAFRRALELSPGSSEVLIQHAWYHLTPRMLMTEALNEARQAVVLDPLSPFAHGLFGLVLVAARQYDRAVEECRTAVQLAPGLWWMHWFYGSALLPQGKVSLGLRHFQKAYEVNRRPIVVGGLAMVYGLGRQTERAKQLFSELNDMSRTAEIPAIAFAMAYIGLGDDRAFECLDRAIEARDPIVTHLPSMPYYDGLRNDARFRTLLAKMHLV